MLASVKEYLRLYGLMQLLDKIQQSLTMDYEINEIRATRRALVQLKDNQQLIQKVLKK